MSNYALTFNGINSNVDISNKVNFALTTYTIQAWINPANIVGEQSIFSTIFYNTSTSYFGYALELYNGNLRGISASASTMNIITSSYICPANVYVHVALTYDGINSILYINGLQSLKSTIPLPVFNATSICNIGTSQTGSGIFGNYFNGIIDDVSVWNFAKAQSQIQITMNQELQGNEIGLVGYWNFNEGLGNIANDLTNKKNNGTLNYCGWTNNCPSISLTNNIILDPNYDIYKNIYINKNYQINYQILNSFYKSNIFLQSASIDQSGGSALGSGKMFRLPIDQSTWLNIYNINIH